MNYKEEILCQNCGCLGHNKTNCLQCQNCGNNGHKTLECQICQKCGSNEHKKQDYCPFYQNRDAHDTFGECGNNYQTNLYDNETDKWNYLCDICHVYGHTKKQCTWCRTCNTFGHGYTWHPHCSYCRKCKRFGHSKKNCYWDYKTFSLDLIPIKNRKNVVKCLDTNIKIPEVLSQLIAKFTYNK